MLVCSLLLLALSVLFLILSIQIYCGNTELIISHHQKNVADKAAYGMDFGKALFGISATLVVSGILFLSRMLLSVAVIILLSGLAVSCVLIIRVQRKHNHK